MKKSGKTPLLRARNIEKKLGIKRIYIKLEGANPSGSKFDRVAQRIVNSAIALNYNSLVAEGSKPYLKSIAYFCKIKALPLKVVQYKNEKWKAKFFKKDEIVDFTHLNKTKGHKNTISFADKENAYLAIEAVNNRSLSEAAFSEISKEIIEKIKYPADSVYFHSDYDFYYNSIYNRYLNDYIENSNPLPKLFPTHFVKDKYYYEKSDEIVVEENELSEAYSLLTKLEHLKLKRKDATAFAAFLDNHKKGLVSKGNHVIILDSAKTRIDIRRLENFSEVSKEKLVEYVDFYLDRYSDPINDTIDALNNAMKDGFILIATREEIVDGVCIVVNMGFDNFIPTYHLAYIGTNPHSKGRGLGTELIEYAIDLADGKISLHVDLDNYRAKKLYEKMGFKHVYNRMIFQNEE
ncbi:MAG: GNAT family N-acetyltransferase [Candidatus Izimaplasma sp.]|nr:GNAT family N-acetyltransferase [Candidatus Izimaplasma bacterium]